LATLATDDDLAARRRTQLRARPLDPGENEPALVLQVDLEVRGVVATDGDLPIAELLGFEDGVTPNHADREGALFGRRSQFLRELLVEERRGSAAPLQSPEVEAGVLSALGGA